jgi:hypothetical protein
VAELDSEMVEALGTQGATPSTLALWDEIHIAYQRGGPDAVWDLLEKKVKTIRKSANVQASEMKAAAGSVTKKGRAKKRR